MASEKPSPADPHVMPPDLLEALRRCRNVKAIIGRGPDGKLVSIPAYPDGVPPTDQPPEPPTAA